MQDSYSYQEAVELMKAYANYCLWKQGMGEEPMSPEEYIDPANT